MLSSEQRDELFSAKDLVDQNLSAIHEAFDDPSMTEVELDPEEALQIMEAFRFLWNVVEDQGLFRRVRDF